MKLKVCKMKLTNSNWIKTSHNLKSFQANNNKNFQVNKVKKRTKFCKYNHTV